VAKAKLTVISSTTQTAPPLKPAEQLVTLTYGQPPTLSCYATAKWCFIADPTALGGSVVSNYKEQFLEQITHTDIIQFEGWRNRQMQKVPRASTLNNFASAWNRLIQTAINRGWVSSPSHFYNLRVFSSYAKIIITRMCAEHVRTLVAHHGHDAGDGDDHDATLLKRASNSPTT
jgi:hypothetical protein